MEENGRFSISIFKGSIRDEESENDPEITLNLICNPLIIKRYRRRDSNPHTLANNGF
jgi:hypothetical protein